MRVDKQLICHCVVYMCVTSALCASLLTYVLCRVLM